MTKLKIKFKSGEEGCVEVRELLFDARHEVLKFVRDVSGFSSTGNIRLGVVSSFELSFESEDEKQ